MNKIATDPRGAGQRYSVLSFNWLPFLLLLAAAVPAAQGQTTTETNESNGYIIIYNNYYLSHNATTGALTAARAETFNLTTCLWSVPSTTTIRPVSSDGTTVLGNLYLRPRSNTNTYSLNTNTSTNYNAWNTLSSGSQPNYNNYYIRLNNNNWQISNAANANRGTLYAVTKNTVETNYPVTYRGSLSGTATSFFATGQTATYTLSATSTAAYSTTTVSYIYSGGSLASTTTGSEPTPTVVNLNDGWTVTWSLSDETYATINSSTGVLTVKATLPATRATTSVQVHATKGGNAIDAELSVTIYASEAEMKTVIIDDREDHNWTYYQATGPDGDYPPELRSPNPRNVKITYRGGSVANASAVAVSPEEPQNTFIYYKTIERLAWGNSTGRWLTGEYAYRVIPNPFSKRPRATSATGTTDGFYGFGGWKIISGGEYIAGHNNGDVLGLEDIINFTGLDAGYTPNRTSAEVVFEATWVTAYVVESITTTGLNGSTYETNFIVVRNNNNNDVSSLGTPATVSSRYPDGTASGYTPTIQNFSTGIASVKLEYIKIGNGTAPVRPSEMTASSTTTYGTGDFTASGAGELIVGRGCTGSVIHLWSGNSGQKYTFRVESGQFSIMNPLHNGRNANANTNNWCRVVLGCDYDRAMGENENLRIINYIGACRASSTGSSSSELQDITVKSGYYGFVANYGLYNNTKGTKNVDGYGLGIGGNTDNFSGTYTPAGTSEEYSFTTPATANPETENEQTWIMNMSFYVGNTRGAANGGVNRMLVEGGEFSSINGGGNNPGNADTIGFHFRMKGGWVKGAVYGTASVSNTTGSRRLVFTGGEVNGWVAGGCNGTNQDNDESRRGENSGICYIYAGGTTEFRSHGRDGVYNNAFGLVGNVPGGQIFGAGRGLAVAANESENIKHYGSTTTAYVVMADEAEVEQNVYGGGYNGVSQASHVYVTGGTVGGKVFGGTARAISQHATWRCNTTDLRMYGGTVLGGVYGSHDETGDQYSNVNVQILGGTVGAADQLLGDGSRNHDLGNVFGCGFGVNTSVAGNVVVVVGDSTARTPHVDNPVIWGNVFGGGHEANYTSTGKTFKVLGYNGTVKESVFGGGKGVLNENKGRITGDTYVWLKGSILVESDVYGGGLAGVVAGNTNVKISD